MTTKFKGKEFKGMSRFALIIMMNKRGGIPYPPTDSINWRLSLYRLYLGLNQMKFSKKVGISQGSTCDIEYGKTTPNAFTLQKIGRIKEQPVDIEWLLLGDDV